MDIFGTRLANVPSQLRAICHRIANEHLSMITPGTTTTEGPTQTDATPPDRPTHRYTEASTETDPVASPAPSPTHTYAEATLPPAKDIKGKGRVTSNTTQRVQPAFPQVHSDRAALIATSGEKTTPLSPTRTSKRPPPPAKATPAPPTTPAKQQRTPPPPKSQQTKTIARSIALHGAPTKHTPGQMRRWIEEDNGGRIPILGIRWLLKECRRTATLASSLVIHLEHAIDINQGVRIWEEGSCEPHDMIGKDRGSIST